MRAGALLATPVRREDGEWSWSASSSTIAARRSGALAAGCCSSAARSHCSSRARRLRGRGRRVAAGRGHAPAGGGVQARGPASGCRPAVARRDREAGKTLNEMLDRLGAASERERGFVADASHELRTPLSIFKAELDVALRARDGPRGARRRVRSAPEETDRLARLAEDLLVIAGADQGKLPIRPSRVEVAALLGDVAERFARAR